MRFNDILFFEQSQILKKSKSRNLKLNLIKKPKCDDKIIMQLGNRLWSINTEIVLEVYKKIVEK